MMETSLKETLFKIQTEIIQTSSSVDMDTVLRTSKEIPIIKRMKIYQDAYRIRLTRSLVDDFSRLEAGMGKDVFSSLVRSFIKEQPSVFFNLYEYSCHFLKYIKTIVSKDMYLQGYFDWIEVLSKQISSTLKYQILDVEEVQDGKVFYVVKNPSVILGSPFPDKYYWGVLRNGDLEIKELEKIEFLILNFLRQPRSVDELVYFIENNLVDEVIQKHGIPATTDNSSDIDGRDKIFQQIFQNGLKSKILHCVNI